MVRHLWRRPSGWTFQAAVPQREIHRLGRTPVRVSLGPMSAFEARRRARILAGAVTRAMDDESMDRKAVRAGLDSIAQELDRLKRQADFAGLGASAATADAREERGRHDPDLDMVDMRLSDAHAYRERAAALLETRVRLEALGAVIKREGEDWNVERGAYERMLDRAREGVVPVALPRLGEVALEVINAKGEALGVFGQPSRYVERMQRAVRAFVDIVGDRPVSEYAPVDLQRYANLIGRLPKTWSTDPRLRGMSPEDVVTHAKSLQGLKPISASTVGTYIRDFRSIWKVIRATYPDHVRALGHDDVTVTTPRSAARAVRRRGLPVDRINAVLALASRESRADDRFLPLLGVLTGARLGELVDLRPDDVRQEGPYWVLDLVTDFEDDGPEGGGERRLKSEAARRLVALPDAILATGFLAWVEGQRSRGGVLWPHLNRAARPRATASKRMIRLLKRAKSHQPTGQVFHSFRHNAKDWMRAKGVDVRTIDLQVGHASDSVAAHYGSPILRPDEIATIATLPLPDGLDLMPYYVAREHPRGRQSPLAPASLSPEP